MPDIHITDSRGRDAEVSAESVSEPLEVRYLDDSGAQAVSRKILRGTIAHDLAAMEAQIGDLDKIAEALVAGDPEVDVEAFGSFLEETSRVYISEDREVVHKITHWETLHNPDGSERERRPKKMTEQNVSTEIPLKWTGKMMKRDVVYNRFVFANKVQIKHVNGLTYDYLYTMAKELEDEDSMLLIAGGEKGNQPLVFRRGGLPYRGFLEGRTDGEKYMLILHLSNIELKAPEEPEEDAKEEKKK